MDVVQKLQNICWCKEPWGPPIISEEAKELLRECTNVTQPELIDDLQEIIKRSNNFPIAFPIDTVRLKNLIRRRPIEKLKENVRSTYPLLHERVLILMANFLVFKRKYGSNIEKELYSKMSVIELIDRILQKRAVCFMSRRDIYKLRTGEMGAGGWENIGTPQEYPPLVLADYLSYDELKLSALVSVSGPTACINDGARRNSGVVKEDNIETDAIIIGVIGPRFERPGRVDCEDILITYEQNCAENGYGPLPTDVPVTAKHMWRKLWADFYQISSVTYAELTSKVTRIEEAARDRRVFTERYTRRPVGCGALVAAACGRRLALLADAALLEADTRAAAASRSRNAFVNIIGAGLGAWRISHHQLDLYILTFLQRIHSLLGDGALHNVSDVNFAYIKPGDSVLSLFNTSASENGSTRETKLFLENEAHPKGGISVQMEDREPSSALVGEHAGKLLVMTYAWDGNAHPGNEFWAGNLTSSGDPAAACSTQVSELHSAAVNPAVCGRNARVAASCGMRSLAAAATAALRTRRESFTMI
ncbi:LOW QUALITY PROTEIN: uncharacterized protein LOC113509428 [Galleria mellonella]|uniref:LOW QUALITY PROTEIN: uncharacterized protein LOC113509428 n=1 Tax=Galleria mellonella TaxID=7137 RepID=A0ABM3MVM5_GALME|nr:LOW QUALITY PROTEIN: uncharacterized protein LOC113509428 [Galleria mellonella]